MRKVLSFVLVLSLVLGSFSMAFAATPAGLSDVAGNANAAAIGVLNNLGVVTGNPDGTYLPAKAVNRAEFAAMITRAMAVPESALAGYTATTFKDTAGYDWAVKYLAFCETKGIILGDGQGNVMPGRTITVNEAMTMVLRAVGYTNNSNELIGAWPSNYVTLAQNLDLYSKVAATVTVDKANAAQILYNALTVTKVVVASDGTTSNAAGGKSLLTGNLDCTKTTDYIITSANYSDTVMDINDIIGARGTAFFNDDSDLIAFKADSKALYGKVDGNYFKVGDTKYTVATTNTYATGKALSNTKAIQATAAGEVITLAGITTYSNSTYDDDGYVTVYADVSGTTINKVYSVVAWKAYQEDNNKVTTANLNQITADKKLYGVEFAKDSSGNIDTKSFKLVGASSLSDIAKDNIVYTYVADSKIRKVTVGKTVVEGKVTEVKSGSYVYVNGTKYEPATFATGDQTLPNLDETVKMYLDADGYVYTFTVTSGIANKYGVVTAYTAQSGTNDGKARIYTADDTSKLFTLIDSADLSWTSNAATDLDTTPSVIGYDLDATGNIKTIRSNYVELDGTVGNVTTTNEAMLTSTKVLKVVVATGSAVTPSYINVASDVVVYTYDDVTKVVDLSSIDSVKLNTNLVTTSPGEFQYILNKAGDEVKAILVNADFASTKDTNTFYGVVSSFTELKDGTTTIQRITGFDGKNTFSKLTDGVDLASTYETTTGSVIKFKVNAAGTIISADDLAQFSASTSPVVSAYTAYGVTLSAVNTDRTVLTKNVTGELLTVAPTAVVYKMTVKTDQTLDKYEVSDLTSINVGDRVWLYDTKGEDANGTATVVVFQDL